jgi:hypothetical protein
MMKASSEDPVQEPGREPVFALLIEAFAEHPVAATVLVLDTVIVTGAHRNCLFSAMPAKAGIQYPLVFVGLLPGLPNERPGVTGSPGQAGR